MASSSKKVRLKVESLTPEGTLYKGYNIKFVPFERELILEFDVSAKNIVFDGVDTLVITPEVLYGIAETLYLVTRVVEAKADPTREKTLQDAAKSAAKKR